MSVETAERTAGLNLFTSSKHPIEPDNTIPINILERFSRSIAESQLKTMHGRAIFAAKALTVSVFPVPAGPYGFDDFPQLRAEIRVLKQRSVNGV